MFRITMQAHGTIMILLVEKQDGGLIVEGELCKLEK